MLGLGASLLWGAGIGLAKAGLSMGGGGLVKGAAGAAAKGIGAGLATGGKLLGKAATNRSMWGTLAGYGRSHAFEFGKAANKYHGLLGGLAKGAGLYGLGSGIQSFTSSDYASDLAPGTRGLLSLAGFGLQFGGARRMVRGAVGSGYAAAERVTGKNLRSSYEGVDRFLAGPFTKGSATNWIAKGAGKVAQGALKIVPRTIIGSGRAAMSLGQLAGRTVGLGSAPLSSILEPTLPAFGRGRKVMQWLTNKHLEAPMGHGLFGLSAVAGLAAHAAVHDANATAGWLPGSRDVPYGPTVGPVNTGILRGRVPEFNPGNYAGMQPAMKSHVPMSVSNLTLGLHRNNNRNMP